MNLLLVLVILVVGSGLGCMSDFQSLGMKIDETSLHPRKLTWNLKMMVSNRNLLFQGLIFRFYVKLRGSRLKHSGSVHPNFP